MLKGNVGGGILAMGDAFKNGGLLLSPFLTIVIGIIAIYNQHLLVRNYYKIFTCKNLFNLLRNNLWFKFSNQNNLGKFFFYQICFEVY